MAALHWIQQNIEKFGGNPSMITLVGHGTGAACIDFLMSSPTMGENLRNFSVIVFDNKVVFQLLSSRTVSSCHTHVGLGILVVGAC